MDSELDSEMGRISASMAEVNEYSFLHDPLKRLHEILFIRYERRLRELFERDSKTELGIYNLFQFRQFHAALLAVAGAQEYLCALWKRKGHKLPYNDLLIVYERETWIRKLSDISALAPAIVAQIIDDFTLPNCEVSNKNLDLYPFVVLDDRKPLLAIVPGLVLVSNSEGNILRVCAARNKRFADVASTSKESEAREDLRASLSHLEVLGPFKLKTGMPDLDLAIVDRSTNSILLAELKWLQKPGSASSREERNKEILKGIKQITFIQRFLTANPDYLVRTKRMERSLVTFDSIYYAVICRDYVANVDSTAHVIAYEALTIKLKEPETTLPQAFSFASGTEWLPALDVDYKFQITTTTCNGVSVQSEMFIPLYPGQLNLIGA